MKRSPAIPTAARTACRKRDRQRCLRCGGAGIHLHHRMRRREGGHGLWNLVTLCDECHRWVHANVASAKIEGWIIPTYQAEPEQTPLRAYWDWIVLDGEGAYSRTATPSAAYLGPKA